MKKGLFIFLASFFSLASAGNNIDLRGSFPPVTSTGLRPTCSEFVITSLFEAAFRKNFSEQCLAYHHSNQDPAAFTDLLTHIAKNGLYEEHECPYHEKDREAVAKNLPKKSSFRPSFTAGVIGGTPQESLASIKSILMEMLGLSIGERQAS